MAEPPVVTVPSNKSKNGYSIHKSTNEINTSEKFVTEEENIRLVTVDELIVEKRIVDKAGLHNKLFSESKNTKRSLESTKKYSTITKIGKPWAWRNEGEREYHLKLQNDVEKYDKGTEKKNNFTTKSATKLPIWRGDRIRSADALNDVKVKQKKIIRHSSVTSFTKSDKVEPNIAKICKVPPIIPPESCKYITNESNNDFIERQNITEVYEEFSFTDDDIDSNKKSDNAVTIPANVHFDEGPIVVQQPQRNLVKINSETTESYIKNLPNHDSYISSVPSSAITDVDFNKNITEVTFDKEFLRKHHLSENLEAEKRWLETDIDYISDAEKFTSIKSEKPKYSKEVSEIEKRWSGEFLENQLDQNSSESSKSSYVEEIGSISSHESAVESSQIKIYNHQFQLEQEKINQELQKRTFDEVIEDTVSTISSTSHFGERFETCNEHFEDNESQDSTLKQSSSTNTCDITETNELDDNGNSNDYRCFETTEFKKTIIPIGKFNYRDKQKVDQSTSHYEPYFSNEERQYIELQKVIVTESGFDNKLKNDGYAELIREITMEPGSSKGKDEKKKKSGLRRLLPGIFSPKDSRKEYKKEHKERKRRDERFFNQHQQNGIYMRSPDTMHLNEDIKRNVNLDTSLNGVIIEERLNEIKQELFPDQGMTTSTPDHFLQGDRDHILGRRTPKLYTANSSLSSIAVEDKWIDQNIISGSPDMRKLKHHVKNENDRKVNLERKHSFQESQPRFVRNHGPSGRISAPPSERFLIRPRAVHPIDRPLPAIPQKVEFTNYENHEDIRNHPGVLLRGDHINYQPGTYFSSNQNYANESELYGTGNHTGKSEINRNHSIDSGFNMTPVSTQLKINRQFINNQNGQKVSCGLGRSPKYSPSSSQKSGDYADSSYTPNSSQKSEFSPGSSKSGEYYLNSPRNSSRMSPDYSIYDRRDQTDHESTKSTSYQIPSNIRVQIKDDRIYNELPKSPFESDKSPASPRLLHHNTNPDTSCVQRSSPIIPLSSNLAKLRANVGPSSCTESQNNLNEQMQSPQISSSTATRTSTSPIGSLNQRDMTKSPLLNSSVTIASSEQRFVSPLTIITPASPVSCSNTTSPRSRSETPLSSGLISPHKTSTQGRDSQCRTPISSPTKTSNYPHMSTFQPRKAQPTDQILIASPKRELIYDCQTYRPSSRMESGCPDSPVPMVDSPCNSISPQQSFHGTVTTNLNKTKSPVPLEVSEQLPPEAFRDEPSKATHLNQSMSPQSLNKCIQRPEPIYVERQNPQVKISPCEVNPEQRQGSSVNSRTPMLLIQAKLENTKKLVAQSNHQMSSSAKEHIGQNVQRAIYVQEHSQRTASPRPMSPEIRKESHLSPKDRPDKLQLRKKDGHHFHERPQAIYGNQKLIIQDRNISVEDIYGKNLQQSPVPSTMRSPVHQNHQRHEVTVQQHCPTLSQNQQDQRRIYLSKQEILNQYQKQISDQHVTSKEPIYVQRNQKLVTGQQIIEPIYSSSANKQSSPSKKQTMQHLEAFYWQQKALQMQKTTPNSPRASAKNEEPESTEVREAIYWHQLKKLDEEQQRKIFERNQFDDRNDPIYWKKKIQNSAPPPTIDLIKQGSSTNPLNQKNSMIPVQVEYHLENPEQMYWRPPMQPTGNPSSKPPLSGQKGQNQPVLVVRPQQAVREFNQSPSNLKQDSKELRSKSVSPHFIRNDERRSLQLPRKSGMSLDDGFSDRNNMIINARKSMTPPIYDEADIDKKHPPPIFKRGSLISNSSSSVEYGTMGTKRVSFSNQSNSPEIGSGNWPTKHGMAPEPPTRKHRTEETIHSDTTEQNATRLLEDNQNIMNNIYGNTTACSPRQFVIYETYDANKPLPPPPNDPWIMKRTNSSTDNNKNQQLKVQRANVSASPRKLMMGMSESESGSEAGEVQRITQRRPEEEWNPGGKGRQSNETGGLGRAEGEGGSNDHHSGRRSGGVGVLGSVVGGRATGTSGGGGGRSRDEPRRHTLSGDHAPSLHHQQFNAQQFALHPHHLPLPHGQYGTPSRHTTMDLEMGTKSRQRKSPLPRGYPPPSTAMLFDDDPGIMSEVETSSTGFRRGGKQRSSLPVVRTPSKTLERPLGLVFLQYRKETKRALLPNEITSIDTVKALFVRSFPKQLTMEYLDSPDVKVYIHDSNKDMFYELEDHRSHLRDIRDRSVLRLIEKTDGVGGISGPLGAPVGGPPGLPPHWEDQSYFSEPEFDSEFQHQHIHKSKTSKNSTSGSYYMGGSSTLPRGGPIMRAYSPAASAVLAGPNATPTPQKALGTPGGGGVAPAKPLRGYQCGKTPLGSLGGSARFSRDSSVSLYSIPDRLHGESGYMSSPERGGGVGAGTGRYPGGPYSTGSSYEEPYYSQYSGTVTPVIDEEASDTELLEESYSLYGVKPPGRPPSGPPRSPFPPGAPALPPGQPYDVTRIRVEHMERQLANLTGLVQKALTHAPHTSPSPRDYLQIPAVRDPYARSTGAGDEFDKHSSSSSASLPDDSYLRSDVKPPKLGKDKSVSFEKSVSFSDEPPDMNSPKQHSPQHTADTKPTKPAIKSSTLPRMSSQERDRHKPTPPPKPVALAAGQYVYRDLALTPEMYNQLRGLQKKAKDLRQDFRNLRRVSQAHAHTFRETIWDTFITIRAMLLSGGDAAWATGDVEKIKLNREEELYKQEMIRLEKDLTELESTVEELRGNVITRKTRVNMSDVENMAMILSKSSKTVADLKVRFPSLQEGMKGLLSSEMEKVVREEKFLKEEPDRLESVLKRCKKLTGTLVTLKRLASVQEQRLPNAASLDSEETPPITPTSAQHSKTTAPVPTERTGVGSTGVIGGGSYSLESSTAYQQRPENALDALLDELQTFSRPSSQLSQVSCTSQSTNHTPSMLEIGRSASQIMQSSGRAPNISDIGRKGSIDSSSSLAIIPPASNNTLRRLHSYPSSSDTDTSPPIARIQVSDGTIPPQKPPVPERNAELLQLATARRVPPPPPPRTSSRSPLASPTSPQLPPRNPTGTLRRGRNNAKDSGKPPMALPPNAITDDQAQKPLPTNNILSTSNSSSCESINSQEGLQNRKDRQEELEQRHQELLRKQKALQEQYARLQQLQRNASGLTTVPPAPPDLLKKTGSESNLLAKMGLGMSAASSGSLTSLATVKNNNETQPTTKDQLNNVNATSVVVNQTATSKIYETDIL